jgi:chromosome segregation ATPase
MSPRKTAAPETRAAAGGAPDVVQQLLAEGRELKIANERLRLEIEEARRAAGKPDRRLGLLEEENRRLRQELAAARAEHERLLEGVARAVQEMEKAWP